MNLVRLIFICNDAQTTSRLNHRKPFGGPVPVFVRREPIQWRMIDRIKLLNDCVFLYSILLSVTTCYKATDYEKRK